MPDSTVKIGFVAPDAADTVRRLESAGAASLWVGGHVASVNPSPEAMMWLARLVEQTERAIVGTATLLLPLYPPAIVAKQVADLDRVAGGRLVLGVGVGGEYDADFAAAEVPVSQRGARANETIDLLRRFWTSEPVTHDGRFHSFEGVRIHPAPTQPGGPPIVVTGRKEPAMRRAALLGDGWMPYLYSPSRYATSVQQIGDIAAEAGRELDDFEWYAYVMVSVDDDPDAARAGATRFLSTTYRQDFDELVERVTVTGDADQVGEKLSAFVDAGARHLVVCPIHGDAATTAELILETIAPRLPAVRT